MTELVAFLRARLDEDVQSADRALEIMKSRVDAAKYGMRVLADVHAKRRILDEHTCGCKDPNCPDCGACSGDHHADPTPAPCTTIKLLALPYADHPDYREEWRP